MTSLKKTTVVIAFSLVASLFVLLPLGVMAEGNQQGRTSSGIISTMKGWEIGVDEVLYQYSPDTIFYDENRQVIGSGYFAKGTKVGMKWYIDGREFRVTEVWKSK